MQPCSSQPPECRCDRFRARAGILLVLLGAVFALPAGETPGQPSREPGFTTDIFPLFQAKCLRCHSGKTPKAELDLSTLPGVLKGGESGPVVVPGKPQESLLLEK